ncbi:uncharacterized protein PADG_01507 [Paracoccidioides brasiliensis Pb18]|uniref:Uncharacterized protein n=2 Tax=Paracoccidioides brasiliensis TaxID=121759 RepID=C1G3J1_PARBD|nr:uncharacterized protein PADG_01507 [Paracoccidioides brasiliensis Pb18]EEH45357.1 hypothetical protein PADG_01507 [Paracoccidioides brasiliensis Pb18]ODH52228.1 hypothetical protein GX48_01545 [Paracoccidioides brasiliensis]
MSYRLVEPHPSVPRSNHPAIHTARGGAGNIMSLKNTSTTPGQSATGPASLTRLDSRTQDRFTTGRGGIGNVHTGSERAIFSFDEELERQLRREKEVAPVFHVGRGGAGNTAIPDTFGFSRKYSGGSSRSISSTKSSGADVAKHKARRSLEMRWGKFMSYS